MSPSEPLEPEADSHDEELSLEQLAEVYARMLGSGEAGAGEAAEGGDDEEWEEDLSHDAAQTESDFQVSPAAIIEAALFVGHPENRPFSEEELAGLMRGVTVEEVHSIIDQLNEHLRQERSALTIAREAGGYRMRLAECATAVRDTFYGRVRDARLSQVAIDVLALIAYHPGITAEELDAKRSKQSGGLVSQLVRRNLVECRREEATGGGKRAPARYYPTERLLNILGLERLEDLPHVQ